MAPRAEREGPMRRRQTKKDWHLPAFRSEAEEVRWWDNPEHRIDFWRGADPVDVEPVERKAVVVSIRLRPRDADRLRKLAAARGMGHVTLLRRVVEQWIERAPGARSGSRK